LPTTASQVVSMLKEAELQVWASSIEDSGCPDIGTTTWPCCYSPDEINMQSGVHIWVIPNMDLRTVPDCSVGNRCYACSIQGKCKGAVSIRASLQTGIGSKCCTRHPVVSGPHNQHSKESNSCWPSASTDF